MKKKVFSLMMTLLLAFVGVAKAEVVEIGTGTSTTYMVPFNSLYNYSFTEQIFLASEIGTAGNINSISFHIGQAYTSEQTNDVVLYMKNVSRETFSSTTDYEPVTAGDIVFQGQWTIPVCSAGDWITLTLDTPFAYDGTSNLMIAMDENTGSYQTRYFYCTSVTNSGISYYSDSYNPDPYNLDSYSGSKMLRSNRNNIQLDITPSSGGGDQLHVRFMNGEEEIIDSLYMGVRPMGAWMEPFNFTMYTEGRAYTVTYLDFSPDDGVFVVEGEELPFNVTRTHNVELNLSNGNNQSLTGLIERQFVAITEGNRVAHVWPVVVDLYDPATPDVWEKACTEATTFPFVEVPATAHNTTLHNDYTLPFPEIPEGYDAVYKLVIDHDQKLDAAVTYGENGKVALYTENFNGEGGPMAHNYYTGIGLSSNNSTASFEVQIGEGTNTTGYFPFYTLYNYTIAENLFLATELVEAGVTLAPMTSLSWYATNAPGDAQQGITIWMANVQDMALTTTSHVVTNMTKVYTGAMTPEIGWNEFVFNEGSFAWDGRSNVLIYCQRNNGAWNSTVSWQATSGMNFNCMSYRYQDSGAFDATIANTMYTGTVRPNIIMKGSSNEGVITVNFEDQQIPADWNNDATYPWVVVSENGSYVMKSSNSGVSSSSSTISATYDLYSAGTISFDALCMGEGTSTIWDKCIFSIDGVAQFTYGANVAGWNNYTYTVNPGTHTFTWSYTKDGSVNPTGDCFMVDNVVITGLNEPMPEPELTYSYGPVIEDLALRAGTYYLVASSTDPDFEVTINAQNMPCPEVEEFAFNPSPIDDAEGIEPNRVTLRWNIPNFATGWRIFFGTTYYPEAGQPGTIVYPEDGSFNPAMANSFTVNNLWNNTHYFWRVEFNNDGCPQGVSSPVWGFTTHLNAPQNLTAVDYTVFDDEQIVLNWNGVSDRTYRNYNVYRDGQLIGTTEFNNISNTTYTDGPLPYNIEGYTYYVTALYDEGESAPSNTVNVKVSGRGNVDGHVYEQDGTTVIAGATVTMVGQDEFGVNHTYTFITNDEGYYSGAVYAGSYNGQAAKDGYQTITEPVQGNPIDITYNVTNSPVDYIMDENFDPVCSVIAQYYPDSTDINAPYVKVFWGCGLPGEEIIEPFETGDFSQFDWQLDPSYPWTITTNNPYEGDYCMMSGGAGVPNVVSNMTVTVNIPADGIMSFFGKISCESNWDFGYFYIDGVQKGSYTGAGSWGEKKFDITAGDHTFQWRYTKDGSVNSDDDCFYVDYITFYKQPEPIQPGWHTWCESEFNNAVGSNLTTTPSWAYEYPANFLNNNYAGWNMTKVSLFSDNMYSAVGGNYTCRIYVGGNEPAAGTMVSTITVDVPSNQNAWVDWDLTTPVNVTGNDPIWVVWTANTTVSSWPAGCCGDLNDLGTWWDGGSGWEHLTYGTWTMRHWFTNRSGRSVAVTDVDNAPIAVVDNNPLSSKLRTYVKGEESNDIICANPNAVKGAAMTNNSNRALSYYKVYRTDCYNDGPYTEENTLLIASHVMDTVYIDVDWMNLAPGIYKWGVSCVYEGNRGEEIEGPITWSTPANMGNAEATRSEFTYGFESGLDGWTVIDVNAGEGTWLHSSNNPGGYDYTALAHGGTGFAMCYSFVDYVGSFNTDSYLVSPQKYAISSNSTLTFWADNANDSYPESFSVCVATTDNPTASDFTQVWSGSAKGGSNAKAEVRHLSNRYENWRSHTVNLGAYAGQNVWIAFHDVNYDQYEVWIDDVTIVTDNGAPTPPTPGQSGTMVVNFEDGQIPAGWINDANYPWVVTTTAYPGFTGTYCMKSGNSGVASSTSAIEATVEFVQDGSVSFLGGCWGEGTSTIWDKCQFFIDGAEQFSYGALQSWDTYSFNVTAGTHTFRWSYTKDGSVNPTGDAFFVDDITFDGVAGGGPNQEPRESEIVWSNCLEKGMYLGEGEVDITVLLNSADSPEGTTVTFINYNEEEQALYPVAPVVLDVTGYYAWDQFRKGDYQITVNLDGYVTIIEDVAIWEPTHLRYVMNEIIYGVSNLYVSRTGWAMWEGHGSITPPTPPGGNGDEFTVDFEGGMPAGWNVIDANNDGWTWCLTSAIPSTWTYYASLTLDWYHSGSNAICSGSYINGVGALTPDEYLVSPQVTLAAGSTLSFWVAATDASYPADHFGVFISDNGTSDWTSVQEWTLTAKKSGMAGGFASRDGEGLRLGTWYNYSVDLSAYAGQKYIAFRHFNCYDQYIMCLDDISLTAGAKSGDRHLEFYKVMCTSIDGEPIYNENTVNPFCQLNTEDLVEGQHYICKVAAVYSTGMSDWIEAEWEYESCANYTGTVNGVDVNGTTITWDYPGGAPVPPPGGGDSFTEGFEGGLNGWNVLTVLSDGGSWIHSNNNLGGYDYTTHAHGGTGFAMCYSFVDYVGAFNTDSYLITPQRYNIVNGSTLTFWADNANDSYPENFSVCVSTAANPGADDFTTVWSGGAKGSGAKAEVRHEANRYDNWRSHSIDLSAYAGQSVWIAFHDVNYDMYEIWIDDVELSNGAKGARNPWDLMMTFQAPEGGHYGVAYDGNNFYTSNWGYSSAAHNFYKYDLSGNMLEGFEIPGCGTLRGITYDGTYFYGVANSSTVYCVDLANHSVVNTFTSAYGAMRGITYDPERDGFWVIGNWSGNLTLIDRTGAIVQTGPTPESASDLAYYKDENDVEHVYCFNNLTNDVDDWVIGNNTMSGSVFNFSNVPGFDGGSSGGCTVGSFNGKIAFIGDIQQSPNLIGIYELRDDNVGPTPPPTPSGDILGAMVFLNGEWEAFVPAPTNTYTYSDAGEYCVRIVYNGTADLPSNNFFYAMSCPECVGGEDDCLAGAPIYAEELHATDQVKVWWGEQNPGPGPGAGDTFIYDFENSSLAGLTLIDADGDGYNWNLSSVTMGTGYGHNSSIDMVFSQSYDNNVGVLYPDNYIVFPQSAIGNGSTFSFWACAQDSGYPAEHFGVAVSTTGTNASDFTMVQEWTMTAKGEGAPAKGNRSGRDQGNWYQYSVDLSAYAGQQAYIAIRHFNCNDWFYLDVDDVELSIAGKSRAEIVKYNVYRSTDNVTYTMIGEVAAVAGQTYYEYIDTPANVGTYYYQVRADYGNCESEPAISGEDPSVNYVVAGVDALDENDSNVALFPNPTTGNVTIQAEGMSRITVVSVLGQVVYDTEFNGDEFTLNMAQFNAGMYMVRVYTENGMTVKRVTVMQ